MMRKDEATAADKDRETCLWFTQHQTRISGVAQALRFHYFSFDFHEEKKIPHFHRLLRRNSSSRVRTQCARTFFSLLGWSRRRRRRPQGKNALPSLSLQQRRGEKEGGQKVCVRKKEEGEEVHFIFHISGLSLYRPSTDPGL